MNIFASIDGNILIWIQENLRVSGLDTLWRAITTLGNGGIFWICLGVVLLCFKKTRKAGIMALLALLINVVLTNLLLKNIIARPRPFDEISQIVPLIARPTDYSFPSGHTAASFACAFVYLKELPRKAGIPLLVLACLIAFSRLYLGVHYPSDVLGGVIIGFIAWIAAWWIFKKIENRQIFLR